MAVPLLDLKVHHESLQQEIMAVLEQTFWSQAFILGPEVEKLEERVVKETIAIPIYPELTPA